MSRHPVHQYQRRVIGKEYVVYACVVPGCNHYIAEGLLEGRQCLCNRCKTAVFIIKRGHDGRFLHKPHCKECTAEPRNPRVRKEKAVTAVPEHVADAASRLAELLHGSAGDD